MDDKPELPTSPYSAVHAEGCRIGLVTCGICGATLIIGADSDATTRHENWHYGMGDLAAADKEPADG